MASCTPKCEYCTQSLQTLTNIRRGAIITQLYLLCGICNALALPLNLVNRPEFCYSFILSAQVSSLPHAAVYLALAYYQYRKNKLKTDFELPKYGHDYTDTGFVKEAFHHYELAYRTYFTFSHIGAAYVEAIGWTIALGTTLYTIHQVSAGRIQSESTEGFKVEKMVSLAYLTFFIFVAASGLWVIAVMSVIEKKMGRTSRMGDVACSC